MRKQKQWSFIITVAAAIMASGLGLLGQRIFTTEETRDITTSFEKSQVLFTQTVANTVEQYFYDIQKRMEIIALMPAVRDAQRSEACNQNLQNLVEINSQEFNNLGRIDKNGTFICAVNRTLVGEPAAKYGTYFATIASDPQHKPVMSPLIFPSGSASPVIAVHVPVYDAKGQFNGTVGGAVYFEDLQDRLVHAARPTPNSVLALYDNNLDILYHTDPLLRYKNLLAPDTLRLFSPQKVLTDFAAASKKPPAEGTIFYSLRGVPRQTVYKSVPIIGRYWTVTIAVPQADINATLHRQKTGRLFLVPTVISILAITLFVYGLSKNKLARPKQAKP